MSKKRLCQRLAAQRAEELEAIANRLLTSPTAEVGEHLDRLAVYSRLLALLQPRRSREWLLAVFVMDGRFMVWGATRVQAEVVPGILGIDVKRELFVPETIVFRAEGKGARPVQLKLCPGEPWVLRHLPIQGLAFTRQIPTEPEENPFVSTIKSGTLTLTDVGQQVTLQENDSLAFIGLQGRLAEVRSGDTLHLRFESTARQVALGPAGFQQSLAPSLLKYYYHQEPLKFFWGAVVFLWGILWGIRKTVLH